MPASSKASLSSLFQTVVKSKNSSTDVARGDACHRASAIASPRAETACPPFVSLLVSSSSTATASASDQLSHQRSKTIPPFIKKTLPSASSDLATLELKVDSENPTTRLTKEIFSMLRDGKLLDRGCSSDSKSSYNGESAVATLDIPWFSTTTSSNSTLHRRKDISQERKRQWILKSSETQSFWALVRSCATKLGTDAAIEMFNRLGRETNVKEYNALIELCLEKARGTNDAQVSAQEACKAFQLLKSMIEHGFQLQEATYAPFLTFLIDMGMVEEFFRFSGVIKDNNPSSFSRLSYYEMLLWIKVNNKEKIEKICGCIVADGDANKSNIMGYLSALCESDCKAEMLQLLKHVNIADISSIDDLSSIIKSLGRQKLEFFAERFILALKSSDYSSETVSDLIFDYASNIPNLAVEDVSQKFKKFCENMNVAPVSTTYEKLVKYCCNCHKVHMALDIADQMCEAGINLSIKMLNLMLKACDGNCELYLVRWIYALIHHHDLKPNHTTFRRMIKLSVRMKDFVGANDMLDDLQKMNLTPKVDMFNAILLGYCREKDHVGVLKVLKKMDSACVKPDAQTFSYLISSCTCERDITQYFEELKVSGVQINRDVYIALIHGYANYGQWEKAKQVVQSKGVPIKNLNDIKSTLVSVLACHGKIADALDIYGEVKQTGCDLDQRSILCLMESIKSEGELSRLLDLLGDLNVLDYWVDGCYRVIVYCVRHKHLSCIIDLLRRLKEKLEDDEVAMEGLFDEAFFVIAEAESAAHLELGMDLLRSIKEELGLRPSRRSLDFLLAACANARDLRKSHLIWKEYQDAGLPYNVVSLLRMYQAVLASGDYRCARSIEAQVSMDEPHVRCFVEECRKTYVPEEARGREMAKKSRMRSGG